MRARKRTVGLHILLCAILLLGGRTAAAQYFDPAVPGIVQSPETCRALQAAWSARIEYLLAAKLRCGQDTEAEMWRVCGRDKVNQPCWKRYRRDLNEGTGAVNTPDGCGGGRSLHYRCDAIWEQYSCASRRSQADAEVCRARLEAWNREQVRLQKQDDIRKEALSRNQAIDDAGRETVRQIGEQAAEASRRIAESSRRMAEAAGKGDRERPQSGVGTPHENSSERASTAGDVGTVQILRPQYVPVGPADSGSPSSNEAGRPSPERSLAASMRSFDDLVRRDGRDLLDVALGSGPTRLHPSTIRSLETARNGVADVERIASWVTFVNDPPKSSFGRGIFLASEWSASRKGPSAFAVDRALSTIDVTVSDALSRYERALDAFDTDDWEQMDRALKFEELNDRIARSMCPWCDRATRWTGP